LVIDVDSVEKKDKLSIGELEQCDASDSSGCWFEFLKNHIFLMNTRSMRYSLYRHLLGNKACFWAENRTRCIVVSRSLSADDITVQRLDQESYL